jgi:hypothetical protein
MTVATLPTGFARFKLTDEQLEALHDDFVKLLERVEFVRPAQVEQVIEKYKDRPGIYFWVMRLQESGDQYRIYVGKTKSISYRVQNYFSPFQPHSPNDFKLQIFSTFLSERVPGASLDLYFSPREESELTTAEKQAFEVYDPLLNAKRRASSAARDALQEAFSAYYRLAFEGLLAEGDAL